MSDKAVVFLAFAHQSTSPLARLSEEDEAIYGLLHARSVQEEHFHTHRDSHAGLDSLREYLSKFKDQVILFHYGGHANSEQLFLSSGEAQAFGIAEMLAEQSRLQLVFLNGCSTQGQVKNLLDLGVPAVIATQCPIEDELAMRVARHFYHAMNLGATLGEAYKEAAAYIKAAGKPVLPQTPYDRFLKGYEQEREKKEEPWGLYYREDRAEVLDAKLPTAPRKRPTRDFEANTVLIEALWKGLTTGDNAPLASMKKEKKLKVKRKCILSEFPAPLAEQLRKLMVPMGEEGKGFDKLSPARLEQLLRTYSVLMEFLTFTLLAQIWERDLAYQRAHRKHPDEALQKVQIPPTTTSLLQEFLHLSELERNTYRLMPLIQDLLKVLDAHEEAYFVEELRELGEGLGEMSPFKGAALQMDLIRERSLKAGIAREEVDELCEEAEESLAELFAHLNYLTRYTLATIKNIDVEKYRNTLQARFRHNVVRLKDLLGGMEEEEETLDRFMDNRSVLLLKLEEDEETEEEVITRFLNLSPFIMDENAFVPDSDLAKIYFYHHFEAREEAWCYRYVNKPSDPVLEVPGEIFEVLEEQFIAFEQTFIPQTGKSEAL